MSFSDYPNYWEFFLLEIYKDIPINLGIMYLWFILYRHIPHLSLAMCLYLLWEGIYSFSGNVSILSA